MNGAALERVYRSSGRDCFLEARRTEDGLPFRLLDIRQPPGDHSDPPLDDLLICMSQTAHRAQWTNGGARWSGRTRPGDFSIIAPGATCEVVIDDPNAFRVVSISAAFAQSVAAMISPNAIPFEFGPFHSSHRQAPAAIYVLEALWCGSGERAISRLFGESLVQALLAELLAQAGAFTLPGASGGLAPWQVRRCLDYLHANLAEDVGVATLADVAHLSPFHFARCFKASVGLPPHRYQLKLRLERAREMLVNTEMSVLEIALAVGFEAPQTLARLFQRELGVTPSAYRRQRRS